MSDDLKFEDLDLDENQEVSLDAEDLLNENGELNEEAVASEENRPSASKVELDLDDAPFLQEDPKEEPEPEEEKPAETPVVLEKGEKQLTRLQKILLLFKNKKVLAGSISGLLLLIILLVFLLGGDDEPPAPVEDQNTNAGQYETEQTPPAAEVPAIPPELIITWEPFWVEQIDSDGQIRFLQCQFSAPTMDPGLKQEADIKTLAIRDAIYYYLSHKPLTFLSDQRNAEVLKEDVLGIINGYLTRGQINQLLIESYLVK